MPSPLPFKPKSINAVLVRPRATHVSQFTGFTQQILTTSAYWKGRALFAPSKEINTVRAWRSWIANLQLDSQGADPDNSFWIPLMGPGWVDTPDWKSVSNYDSDTNRVEVASANDLPADGDLVQTSNATTPTGDHKTSFIRVALNPRTDQGSHYFDVEAEFPENFVPRQYTYKAPHVRAIIINDDAAGITIDATTGLAISPAEIEWQEAVGALSMELDNV